MTIKDLEKIPDKMEIFSDFEKLKQYIRTVPELIDAFSLCLNDEQKLEVMKLDYFQRLKQHVQLRIAMTIKDDSVKGKIIRDLPLMESVFDKYNFLEFLKTVSDEEQIYVLKHPEILKKFNVGKYDIKKILLSMPEKKRTEILSDKQFIKQLELDEFDIADLISGLEDDQTKYKFVKSYELKDYISIGVIKSFSNKNKENLILEDKDGFQPRHILDLISSLGVESVIRFFNNQQEFLQNKNIKPFQVIKAMSAESQVQLIQKLEEIDLPEDEKRRIVAALRNEAKQNIKEENVNEKYRQLLGMQLTGSSIIPNLDGDLSQYKDLDELLSINPLVMSKSAQDRQQLLRLCQVCPNMYIEDNLEFGFSTGEEYIRGEEWTNTVLQGIQPEWTDVQKLAYIDTAIGKRISYTPDFDTEVEKSEDARALWKIITDGYGVCNGIAQVEQYLLGRVGIETELVSGKRHTYVKVKNVKIPTENGIREGDTLVDPTWNLTASRYGAMPQHFCKSYKELRKVDIDEQGKDHECHKNNELEQSNTINMDTENLRQIYQSIGIADSKGKFPIGELIEEARRIDENSKDVQSNISSKFALLKKWCPEFATCQNSTIDVLKDILFENNEHFEFKRCVASRVYDREDPKKQAILYVYMELEGVGKQFFYADKESGKFISLNQQEFEAKFECYEADKQKLPDNKRPWETDVEIQDKKENSSGQVVAEEGR